MTPTSQSSTRVGLTTAISNTSCEAVGDPPDEGPAAVEAAWMIGLRD